MAADVAGFVTKSGEFNRNSLKNMSASERLQVVLSGIMISAVSCCSLSGCQKNSMDSKRLGAAVAELSQQGGSLRSAPVSPSSGLPNQYGVYMDLSESMKPYLNPSPKESTFRVLLRRLNDLSTERVRWFGFGATNNAISQPPPDPISLLDVANYKLYTRRNNDYAALIKTFSGKVDRPIQKLVVSDGVNSPSSTPLGSSLGETAAGINQWIKENKAFGLYLFRSPYYCTSPEFSYFSETIKARDSRALNRVAFNTDKRPFVVMAFASSGQSLREIEADVFDRIAAKDSWRLRITEPETRAAFSIELLDAKAGLKKVADYRIESLRAPVTEYRWVKADSCDLQFSVSVSKEITSAKMQSILAEQLNAGRVRLTCELIELPNKTKEVPAPKEYPIRPNPAKLKEGILLFHVPPPPHTNRRFWHVCIAPADDTPYEMYSSEIGSWSTQDDSLPAAKDSILNLQSLVSEIAKGRRASTLSGSDFILVTN